MGLSPELRDRISGLVQSNSVLLFMKGNRQQPQCGFSAKVVGMLDGLTFDYQTFDVLSDPEVREGIKEFSNWPTIPQLYLNGEFMGGCDIVQEMFASGELHKALGIERVDPIKPTISITDAAAQVLEQARTQQGADGGLRISVSPSFRYSLGFGPHQPGEVEVEANGWQVYVQNDSTHRANGLTIGVVEGQLHIENPNEGEFRLFAQRAGASGLDSGRRGVRADRCALARRAGTRGDRRLEAPRYQHRGRARDAPSRPSRHLLLPHGPEKPGSRSSVRR